MRNFLQKLLYGFQKFMYGRYGTDEFSFFMLICALVFIVLSRINVLWFLYFPAVFLLIFSSYRCYSKNIAKRRYERDKFLNMKHNFKKFFSLRKRMWNERKTYCYFKCTGCKTIIRVPKGKGRIEVSCPKCRNKTIRNT